MLSFSDAALYIRNRRTPETSRGGRCLEHPREVRSAPGSLPRCISPVTRQAPPSGKTRRMPTIPNQVWP